MKNSIISIVLFLCTMVLVFFLNNSLIQLCDEVHQRADVMEETILNGDLESAFEQSMDLVDLLKENNFEASIYITHEYFDTLVDEAVKLSVYISYNDDVDANATLHYIKNIAEDMKKLQIPTIENILSRNLMQNGVYSLPMN